MRCGAAATTPRPSIPTSAASSARAASRPRPESRTSSTPKELGSRDRQTDGFYFDFALRALASRARSGADVHLRLYFRQSLPLGFPLSRPIGCRAGGRPAIGTDVDEYLRRQEISARDYARLRRAAAAGFSDDKFLIVRFGDHQPMFAKYLVDPTLDEAALAQRIDHFDPRYFTTYYAIDAINFTPCRPVFGGRSARRALSAVGGAGSRRRAARRFVRRAEADPAALQRPVLSLQRRRRSAPLQSASDRRRTDQGIVISIGARSVTHASSLLRATLISLPLQVHSASFVSVPVP